MKYNPTPLISGLMTVLAAGAITAVQAEPAPAEATYDLRSGRKPGQIDRVTTLLEVGGHVTEKTDGKIQRKKMSVVCNLSYHERTLEVPGRSTAGWRSVRFYDQAAAVVKIVENEEHQGEMKLALRPQQRLIGVHSDAQDVTLFGLRGPLSRDELELLDIQGNSLLLDRFLPEKPVAVGDTWRHSAELMAALLCVDRVATADVQSTLTGVTGSEVRIEMTGRVEGAVDGVTTEIEIKAKYRFDLGSKRINWFGLLIKEVRNASPVANGVDAVARVQVQVAPAADSPELTDEALKDLSLTLSGELSHLVYESQGGGWRFTYDRRWEMYDDQPDLVVLRMMDRGDLLAQCNVSPLPKLASGEGISLEEFQNDVRKALGESFGEFVEAAQWGNDVNYRVYRVVVQGTARREIQGKTLEVPIQWNYYLVADEHGHRTAFAFTLESSLAERFGDADRKLTDALRFVAPKVAGNGTK